MASQHRPTDAVSLPPRQRDDRYNVSITAVSYRFRRRTTTKHRVLNLSALGACIDNGDELQAGSTILVNVGTAMDVVAEVRWTDDALAGLQFERPLDVAAVMHDLEQTNEVQARSLSSQLSRVRARFSSAVRRAA